MEPRGALNVGMVARSMANFGLKDLVLVNPQGEAADYQGEEVRALFSLDRLALGGFQTRVWLRIELNLCSEF